MPIGTALANKVAWPESFTGEMTYGCRTWAKASDADVVPPDPRPDAAAIKQQATAKEVHRPPKPRGRVPGKTRTLFDFGKLP